jgi:serine/threonine-protein kinase
MCDGTGNMTVECALILACDTMRATAEDTLMLTAAGDRTGPVLVAGPIPERLGRYQIINAIGKGAMGIVYRARDPRISRDVALKAIPLAAEFEGAALEDARTSFFREAQMAGRLNHPNIVTIFDAGEDNGTAYIAMELLRGRHLVEHTTADRLLPTGVALGIVARVADALHFAHQRNVVHRDIKPANLMYERSTDDLKITDFGIARLTDASRTRTGIVLGTPSFMSPEQLQGRPVTGSSDVFSLAVALFQLLTAQLPFQADSMPSLMLKIVQDPHPRIRAIRPDLPAAADELFDRALGKEPENRYPSGAAFAAALRRLQTAAGG